MKQLEINRDLLYPFDYIYFTLKRFSRIKPTKSTARSLNKNNVKMFVGKSSQRHGCWVRILKLNVMFEKL